MAIFWHCGFECGTVTRGAVTTPDQNHWDSPSPAATVMTIVSTPVRSGNHAMRNNCVGTPDSSGKDIANTVIAGRLYFRFASFANSTILRHLCASGNLDVEVTAGGVITTKVGAGASSPTIATLSLDTWYCLDYLADTSGATATLKAQIDHGTEQTASNVQASANMTAIDFGAKAAVTLDSYWDDITLGDAVGDYPIAGGFDTEVAFARFGFDGTHNFILGDFGYNAAGGDVPTSATDVMEQVDDVLLSQITDFIRQKTINAAGYVEGTNLGVQGGRTDDPLAVIFVAAFHSSATGANTCGLQIIDGATTREMLDDAGDNLMDVSQVTVVYAEDFLLNSPSGGSWTKAKMDALKVRWGFSTDVAGEPYWDGFGAEVLYGPAPAVTDERGAMLRLEGPIKHRGYGKETGNLILLE